MAKKSRKERKQAAAKQNTGKQNIVEQNVAVQAAEVKTKVESEDMEAVKVETQEEEAVKTTEAVSESAVEEVKVCEDAAEAKSTSEAVKAEDNEAFRKAEQRAVYEKRFARHFDELKWLYMELYGNSSMFAELCDNLYRFYEERNKDLKEIDQNREACPDWYKQNDMLGMMFYIDNFAGNMKGVESKLDYVEKVM